MIEIGTYTFNYPQLTVFGLMAVSLLVQLFYYLFFYIRVYSRNEFSFEKKLPPVSVVICARNEEANLKLFLPEILKQDYPDFQVVVVDDCSDDNTAQFLATLSKENPKVYFTQINPDSVFLHSKKLALTVGIKAAKHEIVVLTDADCYPKSNQWLKQMLIKFDEKTDFVLGYGAYEHQSSLLNYLIRFDTAIIGMQYITFAQAGIPYMGVGRNLAYRKNMFFDNKGFGKHYGMRSGDDDLLVNKMANSTNTKISENAQAHTISVPETTWADWKRQKQRHRTTFKHYKALHKILLSAEPLSRVIFYFSFVVALVFFPTFAYYLIGAFALRSIIMLIVGIKAFKVLNEKYLGWGFLFLDVIMPIVYLWLARNKKKPVRKQSSWM